MRRFLVLLALAALPCAAVAQAPTAAPSPTAAPLPARLVVGITDSPPFATRSADGVWTGLAVSLWEAVAERLEVAYDLRPVLLGDVGRALNAHEIDVAIGAIAVTPEAAAVHDLTQPFLATGLGFAQRHQDILPWSAFAEVFRNRRLLLVVASIILAVFVVGVIIALLERRARASDFGGSIPESVSTGVWWAAVTMTTVGYGDATPKTAPGRALALVWMFVGVVAVAILTATVTSVLTIAHLRGSVNQAADLFRLRLGAVAGGAGADYLDEHHVAYTSYPTYDAALEALADGRVDAAVGNIPVLRSLVAASWSGQLQVSPIALEPALYALGLPLDSPLTPRINRAVLAVTHDAQWKDTEERFLGHH